MPDVQEVFRMATQKVRPDPGALERQLRGQRRRTVQRKVGGLVLAGALVASAAVVAVQASHHGAQTPANNGRTPQPVPPQGEPTLTVPRAGGVGFSSDGSRLLVIGCCPVDSAGSVYDAVTGELLQSVDGGGMNEVVSAFSPDGDLFATAKLSAPVYTRVFTTATGKELWRFDGISCCASFSPDGRLLGADHGVFDVVTGKRVNKFDPWGVMAFSPDSERLLISPDPEFGGGMVVGYVFDVRARGTDPVLTLRGNFGGGNVGAAWSPDGSMLATATNEGNVVVWDARTGARMFAIDPPAGKFKSVAFSPDSTRLATGTSDGTAIVWELSGDGAKRILTLNAQDGEVAYVSISPDGTRLMTSAWGEPTKVWAITP